MLELLVSLWTDLLDTQNSGYCNPIFLYFDSITLYKAFMVFQDDPGINCLKQII